jgi:imidazolonepropionase-like amidohydrolase
MMKTRISLPLKGKIYAMTGQPLAGLCLLIGSLFAAGQLRAQQTFPVNGVTDPREGCYAFTKATIVKSPGNVLPNATLVIRNGRVVSAGTGAIPADAVIIDCTGKFIYPSFVDAFSDYGTQPVKKGGGGRRDEPQFISATKGAYGWNQAIKSEVNTVSIFTADAAAAANLREAGFGTVLTHQQDGIARGTGVLVTLADGRENKAILKEKASAQYSFDKGSSTQNYPNSLMGSIALLRQTYLDAQWYRSRPEKEGVNLSLQAWNDNQSLPQVFDVNDKWDVLRADKIGDEFGTQYIIKAGGNEYQRIPEMIATKATFILPLSFPLPIDVEDPDDARFVSLADMKHWEMAPTEPAAFEKANIPFCLTADGLKDVKQFLGSVRKAIEYGLTEQKALEALTLTPARLLKADDQLGSLDAGKLANFLIASGNIFSENTVIYQNWVQGKKYSIKDDNWKDVRGTYTLTVTPGNASYTVLVKGTTTGPVLSLLQQDTLTGSLSMTGELVKVTFPVKKGGSQLRLTGIANGNGWSGTGTDTSGNAIRWQAVLSTPFAAKDSAKTKQAPFVGNNYFPFNGYGWETLPVQQDLLIKNTTVWTSEQDGKLENTDVLIRNGKIAQIGRNLATGSARVIDGAGKHLTAGIIDEHSHIAISRGVNEGTQSVTAEVRIADVVNPDDVNIYRQLSGGVTASHLLHGSANTIGGQSQLIKLRWGADAEALKFAGSDPFIKFALGENVKQSNWGDRQKERFPQTRMGVEQVLMDAFTRAGEYEKLGADKRRDLELETLLEIMRSKRFVTCHSYVQSEINMLMKVADTFHFHINTFTHILEGYKVADKMKAHGAGAGTFADWWAYKMEVQDAIPYNATIMQRVGLTVAINSDDAEMARRLNQEGAKSIKYGGITEEEALKLVTLNPARLLHVADRTGSIKTGKDADLVLWSDNPMSIYAKAEKTIVDGVVYFDREKDKELRARISTERNRLIRKMLAEKKKGTPTQKAAAAEEENYHCEDLHAGHQQAMLGNENANN